MIDCPRCAAEIPEGGRFCIECGAPATAATERMTERTGKQVCATCGTRNPSGAAFCVYCGQALHPALATISPPAAPPLLQPNTPAPLQRAARPAPPKPASQPFAPQNWDGVAGGMWLIGLAVLFLTGWWWPGILVLAGLSVLLGSAAARRQH